jgi:transcriptional regulator with XRE-family HTH domain
MPKSVDVEDFATKLALLAKRLNWSRAKLAQQVGVDKSLAARWLNGASRPTGNSLMQLTHAVAQAIDGFTAADWDLPAERFSERLGISYSAAPAGDRTPALRLALTGLRNPPPARTWGTAYVGLWAGFYQSFTNRGVARMTVAEFLIDTSGLRFAYTDGFFNCIGIALATNSHLQAVCEIIPLDNHLIFFSFNAAHDMQGVAIIDGVSSAVGPDDTPAAGPVILFRIDEGMDDPEITFQVLAVRVAEVNDRIESEAARTGDPLALPQQFAPRDVLSALFPCVGAARPDGSLDHLLRVPSDRSLAAGKLAMKSLPADSPIKAIPENLRCALGIGRSAHPSGS